MNPLNTPSNGALSARDEICDAVKQLHADSVQYWSSFPTEAFLAQIGEAWSPAENVRHLTKSMRAMSRGLKMPRLFVRLRFGKAPSPSRSFEQVRETYRATLARGGKAGSFTPSSRPIPVDAEAERAQIMTYHAAAVSELCSLASRWSERDLDRLQFPHPLMGPLTVREMLLFMLYHNSHHVEGVRRRLATS